MEKTYKTIAPYCMTALKERMVKEIHFVYDVRHNTTCWCKKSLLKCFVSSRHKMNYTISEEYIISEQGNDQVNHPLFGLTSRLGWANMTN